MKRLFLALAVLLAASAPAAAQDSAPKVAARLIAEGPVAPGASVWVALEEAIHPGWHTYWINPGDAGAATTLDWTLPAGWKASAIAWPRPKRLPVGPLMDYGYEGKVWLLAKITAPANAKTGETVNLKAATSWLVCKDICVPEDATLTLPLTVGTGGPNPATAKEFAAARALLPTDSPWKITYAMGSGSSSLDLYVAAPALAAAHPVSAAFFPLKPGMVKGAAEQQMGFATDGLVLRLTPGRSASAGGVLNGVLVLTSSDGSVQALNVEAPKGAVPSASFGGDLSLWLALLFAALGGLILNVMPCVLPILAMKALALARHSGHERGAAAKESFAYAAGAVLSFVGFGLALVLLRAGGEAVGWGFQLQSPVAVAGFALLIFAVALNLSGAFEFGSVTLGENLTHKSGFAGAFFTGVLAVAVAAPCTAPFMAAALGFALTQGAASALLIFFFLGLGFALPFLVLGLWPRALTFLPKPGTWMLRFKQLLAFPMYAAAAWLAWVLTQQAGPNSLAILFAATVAVALAAWMWSATRELENRGRLLGTAAALLILLAALYGIAQLGTGASAAPASATASLQGAEPYSEAKLATLRAANRPVLIDATAAWCITCLVNEEAVLSRGNVQAAFAARHVALLVADWTNRNAAITALLSANGRSGVPLYLYYAPGAASPIVLPQVLTESTVLDAIAKP